MSSARRVLPNRSVSVRASVTSDPTSAARSWPSTEPSAHPLHAWPFLFGLLYQNLQRLVRVEVVRFHTIRAAEGAHNLVFLRIRRVNASPVLREHVLAHRAYEFRVRHVFSPTLVLLVLWACTRPPLSLPRSGRFYSVAVSRHSTYRRARYHRRSGFGGPQWRFIPGLAPAGVRFAVGACPEEVRVVHNAGDRGSVASQSIDGNVCPGVAVGRPVHVGDLSRPLFRSTSIPRSRGRR